MANNIANKLIVKATTQAEIEDFLSAIAGAEEDIDFEKIVPMPECLVDSIAGSENNNAVYYYLMTAGKEDMVDKLLPYPQLYSMDRFKGKTEEQLSDYKVAGEKAYSLALQCGSIDWYYWRISNWGTKWNAYGTYIENCCDGSVEIYFSTAWDGVIPIIEKLVEMFPNLEFIYRYADENMSYNCGEGYGADGSVSFKSPEDGSDEAMALYVECWQEDWSNFVKTEDGWTYN